MTKELEDRLAALEQELAATRAQQHTTNDKKQPGRKLKPARRSRSKSLILIAIIGGALVLGGGLTLLALHSSKTKTPIPASIRSSLGFDVYYPGAMPTGYSYAADSVSVQASVLFFKVKDQGKEILFIEQANPKSNLLLDSTVGLNPIDTPNGKAYVGKNQANPVGIVQAKQTLVNVTGTSDVPDDVISGIMRSLKLAQ